MLCIVYTNIHVLIGGKVIYVLNSEKNGIYDLGPEEHISFRVPSTQYHYNINLTCNDNEVFRYLVTHHALR